MCYRYRTVIWPINNSILPWSQNTDKPVAVKFVMYQPLHICNNLQLKDPIYFWEVKITFLVCSFLELFSFSTPYWKFLCNVVLESKSCLSGCNSAELFLMKSVSSVPTEINLMLYKKYSNVNYQHLNIKKTWEEKGKNGANFLSILYQWTFVICSCAWAFYLSYTSRCRFS